MYFITLINKMTDEEVKNLKFDFSWITLAYTHWWLATLYKIVAVKSGELYNISVVNAELKEVSNWFKYNISVVNAELKEVSSWFKTNKLSVDASKTNYMILGTSHMT